MKIRARYYAAVREAAGVDGEVLDIQEGASLADLLDLVIIRHGLEGSNINCLVNNCRVVADHLLHEGDSVIIFPPVAGG